MASTNENWLKKVNENILEPELPICDSHHHLWEFRKEFVESRYLIDEFLNDLNSGHNIVSTVFVECGAMHRNYGPEHLKCIGETEFVNGISAMSSSGLYGKSKIASGIIGTVPMLLGADKVAEALDQHLCFERFKGVRYQANTHSDIHIPNSRINPPKGLYLNDTFRESFEEIDKRGLSFEAWCYHTQLDELADLAKRFSNTKIILNHFGGPLGIGIHKNKKDQVFQAWLKSIKKLSEFENVFMKMGGLAMEINGYEWHKNFNPPSSSDYIEETKNYYLESIDHFGVERCMFESNFPVDKLSISYATLWNAFKLLSKSYSDYEKSRLFHGTAIELYKLD